MTPKLSHRPTLVTWVLSILLSVFLIQTASTQVAGDRLEVLLVGVRDFATLPGLAHVPVQLEGFRSTVEETISASGRRVVEMTDSDDGTPEFPIESNLTFQIGRLTSAPETSARGVLFFSGYAAQAGDAIAILAADSDGGEPPQPLTLARILEGARNSRGREMFVFALVPAPDANPVLLRESAREALAKSRVPTLVILWPDPPVREEMALVTSALREAFAGADFALGGNGNGQNEAAEIVSFVPRYCDLNGPRFDQNFPILLAAAGTPGDFALVAAADTDVTGTIERWERLRGEVSVDTDRDLVVRGDVARDAAFAALEAGKVREAIEQARKLAEVCDTVEPDANLAAEAQEARATAEELRQMGVHMGLQQSNPGEFAGANALFQTGVRFLESQDYELAQRTLTESARLFSEALLTVEKERVQEEYGALGSEEWLAYAPLNWADNLKRREKAAEAESSGRYVDAVRLLQEMIDDAAVVQSEAVQNLLDLALPNMTEEDFATAEYYLTLAIAIEPGNEEARGLLAEGRTTLKYKPGDRRANSIGMDFAFVPAGTFTMGSPGDEQGRDIDELQRKVTISKGFFLGVTEVTWRQWRRVMGDAKPNAAERMGADNLPVSGITWQEANDFCARLSEIDEGVHYRLPTEAEWEYACRAGTQTAFNTRGDLLAIRDAAVYDPVNMLDGPVPVGSVGSPNAWGLEDMHGNLWEWCADWSATYDLQATLDPAGPPSAPGSIDTSKRIARGGSWFDESFMARSANRGEFMPVVGTETIGFRVLMDAGNLSD